MGTDETSPDAAMKTPPRRRWLSRLVPAGVVVAGLVVVGLVAQMPANEVTVAETPPPAVNVKTWRVAPQPELADTVIVSAVVEPEAVVEVAAEVAGRVERFAERQQTVTWRGQTFPAGSVLDEGEPVAAGAPIVYLNKDLLQAQFEQARSQFEYDQREFRRLQGLFERGATSQTELDDARTRLEISKAVLAEARQQLDRTTIYAPTGGILNRLPMEIGEYATPGTVVAEIVNIERVKVAVDVPERDVHFMEVGEPAEVLIAVPAERSLTGTITYIGELADPQTRTSRLEITIDNEEHILRSGQIVKARLTRRVLEDVIMVPLGSVIPLEVGRVVYVVDEQQRAERRPVELGMVKGRSVHVLSGLAPDDELIVVGHRYVGPEQPVNVVEELALEQ